VHSLLEDTAAEVAVRLPFAVITVCVFAAQSRRILECGGVVRSKDTAMNTKNLAFESQPSTRRVILEYSLHGRTPVFQQQPAPSQRL